MAAGVVTRAMSNPAARASASSRSFRVSVMPLVSLLSLRAHDSDAASPQPVPNPGPCCLRRAERAYWSSTSADLGAADIIQGRTGWHSGR